MSTRRLDGDAELRKVASAGREWMFKHGRKIDMESESLCLQISIGTNDSLRIPSGYRMGPSEQ